MTKTQRALVVLLAEIDGGREYPDAHTDACTRFNLTDAQTRELARLYDEREAQECGT